MELTNNIVDNIVFHCRTKTSIKSLFVNLHNLGYCWYDYDSLLNKLDWIEETDSYNFNICYYVFENYAGYKFISCNDIENIDSAKKKVDYDIHRAKHIAKQILNG
jgi:hypothetical protein